VDRMNVSAFLSYALLMTFTPGPNNIMSMINAGRYGLRRSYPFNLGAMAGYFIVMTVSAAFSALLYDLIPSIEPYMLILGACYLLWLAWSVWRSPAASDDGDPDRTATFLSGFVLQFVNVKVLLCCITTMSSFVLPWTRNIGLILAVDVGMTILSVTSTLCWALFGSAMQRFFREHRQIVNTVMALLLVYCAVTMILELF